MAVDGKITLKIATPGGVYEGTFEESTKIHDVIAAVVKEMNLAEGDAFELAFDGKTLPPDSLLGSFGLDDGAVLDLIATGSAV